jgi:hypothetical protein
MPYEVAIDLGWPRKADKRLSPTAVASVARSLDKSLISLGRGPV